MKRERLFYGGAIAVLVAVLILGLWYKQPKTIREITGIAEPDNIYVSILRRNMDMSMEQRELPLSAGDEGFDALMAQLDQLEFRRPPTNLLYIALPFLTELGESPKEWEDGDFQHLYITLSTSAQGKPWPSGEVSNLLYIALPFLTELGESPKEWEDGDFQHLYITLSTSAQGKPWPSGEVSFWIDQWSYRDYEHSLTLPLAVVDSKEIGQALCAQLWEISQPVES